MVWETSHGVRGGCLCQVKATDSHPDSAGRKPVEVGSSSLSDALSKEGSTEVPVEKTEEERRCDEAEDNVTREEEKTTNQAEDTEDEQDGDKVVRLGKMKCLAATPNICVALRHTGAVMMQHTERLML